MQSGFKLTPTELEQVCKDILAGSPEAVGKLVLTYDPLLLKKARLWMRKYRVDPAHLSDVHSLFVVTALHCAPKFDYRMSNFATFMRFPLQSAFAEYIGKSYLPLAVPSKTAQEQHRLHATVAYLIAQNLPVTFETIVERCSVSEDIVHTFLRKGSDVQVGISLDVQRTDGGLNLQEVLAAKEPTVLDILMKQELSARVYAALGLLSDREVDIVKCRYLDQETQTLEQISQRYKLSRERVRQLEKGALVKFKKHLAGLGVQQFSDLVGA